MNGKRKGPGGVLCDDIGGKRPHLAAQTAQAQGQVQPLQAQVRAQAVAQTHPHAQAQALAPTEMHDSDSESEEEIKMRPIKRPMEQTATAVDGGGEEEGEKEKEEDAKGKTSEGAETMPQRRRGRPLKGKSWNAAQGCWVAEEEEEDKEDCGLPLSALIRVGDAMHNSNPDAPPTMKRRFITITLARLDGSFGIALSGNVVTEVKEGGAAAAEGTIKVGDMILEVNGKDTAISGFASLLPKDKEKSIILKLLRMVTVEAAAAEATEKATAKLQAALDAPDLAEGAEPSAVETRRKMLATAVSVATKAGLDAEAIKPAEAKLAALPPPVEDAGADDKPVLAPAFTHIAKIKPPPSAPAEEEEEAAAVPEAPPPYVVPPYVVPPYVVPGGPEQQAAIFAAQAAASAAAAAAAAAVGFPPP